MPFELYYILSILKISKIKYSRLRSSSTLRHSQSTIIKFHDNVIKTTHSTNSDAYIRKRKRMFFFFRIGGEREGEAKEDGEKTSKMPKKSFCSTFFRLMLMPVCQASSVLQPLHTFYYHYYFLRHSYSSYTTKRYYTRLAQTTNYKLCTLSSSIAHFHMHFGIKHQELILYFYANAELLHIIAGVESCALCRAQGILYFMFVIVMYVTNDCLMPVWHLWNECAR